MVQKTPQRKHVTEIVFNLASQGVMITHPKDIGRLDEQSKEVIELASDCHIYLIAKRPRLGFVPDTITWNNGITKGKMYYAQAGRRNEIEFQMEGEPNGIIQYSDYPHNTITLINGDQVIGPLPAHLISLICNEISDKSLRDLEVVYIGMSYGDGDRAAKDRLKNHSTLQQVLADMNSDEPDSEALLILVQYAPPFSIITIDGRDKSLSPDKDRDVIGDLRKQQELIYRKTEIALAEAGLIKYFKPKYNDKYKNNFPDRAHKVTESLYAIDFNAFVVELNTEEVGVRLFSKNRRPGFHHIASYDLHNPQIRKSFFNLLESSSSYSAETFSGPSF
jgi:hypothetical protein